MGRGGSPSGPKIQARTRRPPHNPNPPARRQDIKEGIFEPPEILPCCTATPYEIIPRVDEHVGLKLFSSFRLFRSEKNKRSRLTGFTSVLFLLL